MMLRSSGAIRSSDQPVGMARDQVVQFVAVGGHSLCELAGERLGALEQLPERPAGDLVLIEREDGVPSLVGSLHRTEYIRRGRYLQGPPIRWDGRRAR